MLPSVKSILFAVSVSEHTSNNHHVLTVGQGDQQHSSVYKREPRILFSGSLASGPQSVTEDVARNSAFAICQSFATGDLGTAVVPGFVQGTGVGVGLGSIFSKWKHNVKYCKYESSDNTDGSKADGTVKEDNTGLYQGKEMKT
ncbi:hypothetical protein H9L39_07405 [Fusarium oxysporum f. sp. albedinis]|nr:hypothetical protein FOMA001_g2748 [Fusarium oxysporum f. sp. matthiolae]KAK2481766.1 hypothetical protein H9L39_07405 [Fusarium oxysporum f. sp. albedinis]